MGLYSALLHVGTMFHGDLSVTFVDLVLHMALMRRLTLKPGSLASPYIG